VTSQIDRLLFAAVRPKVNTARLGRVICAAAAFASAGNSQPGLARVMH